MQMDAKNMQELFTQHCISVTKRKGECQEPAHHSECREHRHQFIFERNEDPQQQHHAESPNQHHRLNKEMGCRPIAGGTLKYSWQYMVI